MNSDKLPNEKEIFLKALEFETPGERARYLEVTCRDDPSMRDRIEALLASHANPHTLLNQPLVSRSLVSLPETVVQPTDSMPDIDRIGPYKLLQVIGEGGFGIVYMAEQEMPIRRRVAVKVLKPGMDSHQVLARFEAERQALAMMDHPNIARVYDAGMTDEGRPYFVMELIKGQPISDYCDHHALSLKERLELFLPVCHAIHHAHQKGIIHRDIKPSNILVCTFDGKAVPKVIDFGVAKALSFPLTEKTLFTHFGQVIGTPEFMSPEQTQLDQLDIDTRSDVYSLGVVLYMLLTGSTPISRAELMKAGILEMLQAIRENEPECPSLRINQTRPTYPLRTDRTSPSNTPLSSILQGELDWIVMKSIDKDRNRRYASANELASDIDHYLKDEPVSACPPSRFYLLRKALAKHRVLLRTSLGVATALALTSIFSLWQWSIALHAMNAEALARKQSESAMQSEHEQRILAEKFAEEARIQEYRANTESKEAELRAKQFREASQRAIHNLYVTHMNLVGQHLEAGDLGHARRILERYSPPTDPVGFEWRRCKNVVDAARPLKVIPALSNHATISEDGNRIATSLLAQGVSQTYLLNSHSNHSTKLSTAAGTSAFSSDGTLLATGSIDHEEPRVTVFDIEQETSRSFSLSQRPLEIAFARQNQILVVRSVSAIDCIELDSGEIIRSLHHDQQPPTAIHVIHEVQPGLVVGYADGAILHWNLDSMKEPSSKVLYRQKQSLRFIHLNAHTQTMYVWNSLNHLVQIDLQSQKVLKTMTLPTFPNQIMALHSESPYALVGEPSGTVYAIHLKSGAVDFKVRVDTEYLSGLQFLKDGKQFFASGSSLQIWELSPRELQISIARNGSSMAMSPSGRNLLCGHHLHDLDRQTAIPLRVKGAILAADFSADGKQVVVGTNSGEVQLLDADTGKPLQDFQGHRMHVPTVAIAPNGRWIASGSMDFSTRLWEIDSPNSKHTLSGHTTPVTSVAFSPDSRFLATAQGDRRMRLYQVESGELIATFDECDHIIQHVQFSPDQSHIALCVGNDVEYWHVESKSRVQTFRGHSAMVWSTDFSRDGSTLASASQDRSILLWDVATGEPKLRQSFADGPRRVKFSQDDTRMAVGTNHSVEYFLGVTDAPSSDNSR